MKHSASSRPRRVLTTDAVERLAGQLIPKYREYPAGPAVRRKLQALERNCRFTPRSRQLFEELLGHVGVASTQGISLPVSNQPFWFRAGHPLANYQSAPTLPPSVDVLIIGAGLTGASAAYHLGPAVRDRGLHVAVIDRGDPATEASGRNGGSFGLLPENSVGLYGGLARERLQFLLHVYPSVPIEVLRAESERQASLVLGMALRNRDRLQQIIDDESIDCDFSPRGWIYLAHSDSEEQGMCEEVMLAAQHGQRIELWSRRKIFEEFDIRTDFVGRFIPSDGTYHPFKYVCGVISAALKSGVELYTRVHVKRIRSMSPDRHYLTTDRGRTQRSGCLHSDWMRLIGIPEVLDASMAGGGRIESISANNLILRGSRSGAFSCTRSAFATASLRSAVNRKREVDAPGASPIFVSAAHAASTYWRILSSVPGVGSVATTSKP